MVRHWRTSETGMVTAELALAIPALVLVLVLALQSLALGVSQVRCTDAARAGARAAARGESSAATKRAALQVAPKGAAVQVQRRGSTVQVTVSDRSSGPAGWVGFRPRADAVAEVEP